MRIAPHYAEAYFYLGSAFIKNKMYHEALGAYEEFVMHSRQKDSRLDKAKELIGKLAAHLKKSKLIEQYCLAGNDREAAYC